MHLCWISDSPDTPSGFGNVTRFVCEGLAARGHRVSILGWQTETANDWNGCKVYPSQGRLGSDALYPLLVRHRPDLVVALADVWWLPYFAAPHIRRQMEMTQTPWALYFPIDGDTGDERLPPGWVDLLREVDMPIAMSRYGQRIARRCGIDCEYVPHGVDLDIFRPPADRGAAKRRVGAEGKFLVLSDSRNQPRKMIPRLLDAFGLFAAGKDDVLLHLHTDPDDPYCRTVAYSYDVREDIRRLDLAGKVRFTPGMVMKRGGGIPLRDLAAFYQAADVHLLASSGEGFGLPTLQAAAAGAVPMAGAYSASEELVSGHGEAIAVSDWTENEFGIRRALIDTQDAAAHLERYYGDRALLARRSGQSRAFAEAYGWDQVVDRWDGLIRSIGSNKGQPSRPATLIEAGRAGRLLPAIAGLPSSASVRVNMVEREFGRLEAAIADDARGRSSDVRIPTMPKAIVVGGVKALRRPGQVGLAMSDAGLFQRLRRIFPLLSAWTAANDSLVRADADVWEGAEVTALGPVGPEFCRLHVAQSVLLLNLSGGLPAAMLIDAAALGVPCVGTGDVAEQRVLWPALCAETSDAAVALGRKVLSDAAFAERVSAGAIAACRIAFAPDEANMAVWLRRLSVAHNTPGSSVA
jgi:glycosyltransferase involved in cell wall biosynthesis